MARPVLSVQIYLNGSYVEVGDRCYSVTYSCGASQALAKPSPGRGSFLLDNSDRLLDPDYAAGTYYGYLDPTLGIYMRVRGTDSGATTRTMWKGQAISLEPQWSEDDTGAGETAYMTIAGDDFLGYFLPRYIAATLADGRPGDTLDDLISQISGVAGIWTECRNGDTGHTTTSSGDTAGSNLADIVNQVAEGEMGWVYASPDDSGNPLGFVSRNERWADPVAVFTDSATPGAGEFTYDRTRGLFTSEFDIDQASVTRQGGVEQLYPTFAALSLPDAATYAVRQKVLSGLRLADDTQGLVLAALVHGYLTTPHSTFSYLEFEPDPVDTDAMWDLVCQLNSTVAGCVGIGSRITVKKTPWRNGVASTQTSKDCFVEGIQVTIPGPLSAGDKVRVRLTLSDAQYFSTSAWVIGSATRGKIGTASLA